MDSNYTPLQYYFKSSSQMKANILYAALNHKDTNPEISVLDCIIWGAEQYIKVSPSIESKALGGEQSA